MVLLGAVGFVSDRVPTSRTVLPKTRLARRLPSARRCRRSASSASFVETILLAPAAPWACWCRRGRRHRASWKPDAALSPESVTDPSAFTLGVPP
jgi:hypothetical protein